MVDILIKNATIVTVNENRGIFFFDGHNGENDKVVAVGPTEEILKKKYPEGKKETDAEGKIFPDPQEMLNLLLLTLF